MLKGAIEILNDLILQVKKASLRINIEKTKILTKEITKPLRTENGKIKIVHGAAICLEQLISYENGTEREINRRINLT